MRGWLVLCFCLGVACETHGAGPKVAIVVGEKASGLERRAAEVVSGLVQRLYEAEVTIGTIADKGTGPIFIGDRTTNRQIQTLIPDWKPASTQSHLVQSVTHHGQPALVIGGASPAATYWAAAEYAHRLGVRSLLFGDLDPVATPPFTIQGFDLLREPLLKQRAWEFYYDLPTGPLAWSLEEQQRLIGQLGKLKYNRLVVRVSADQPFVHFAAAGIQKKSGELFQGRKFPVSGDTAGRAVFRGAKFFENPDFAGKETYEQRLAAGQTLLRGVIDAAHGSGLTVGLAFDPFEFPPEFASVTEQNQNAGARLKIAKAQLDAYQKAYPTLDAIYLSITDKSALEPCQQLLADHADHPPRIALELTPSLAAGLPPRNAETVSLIDAQSSARRLVENEEVWRGTRAMNRGLVLNLADDCGGVLPQAAHSSLAALLGSLRKADGTGFTTRIWNVGEQDLSAYFLSRGSFDDKLTPEKACQDLVTPICGEEVADRVFKALDFLERATTLLDQYDLAFSAPRPDVVLKHLDSDDAPPPAWAQAREAYLNAMNEMYRANSRAREGGRAFTLYLARRSEFGFEYLNCIEAVRKAGIAKRKQNPDAHVAELEKAMESMNGALNALAAVARSSSDRGTIAALNEYGYRPLVKAVEAGDAEK
jgi:hypothetical protein